MEQYNKIISNLNCTFESYKKYMVDYLKKDNLVIYIKTSLILSVLQRSLSMVDAYSKLLKTNNIMVLNSIARTQIDNCIFIYGVYLLINNNENINDIYHNFISNNKKLNDYKIEKQKLYDTYIVSKLNEVYNGFEDMYNLQWLKLEIKIFSNRKIQILLKETDRDTYFRVWIQLIIIAMEYSSEGKLIIGKNTPMTIENFSKIIGKSKKKMEKIIKNFKN